MVNALVYGAWLMHLFMVQVDYRLMYMVDAWFRLLVQVVWCWLIGTCLQQYMLALCNLPKAAEAITEVTSNRLESWI
jgi:hypothetical protein